MRFCGLDQALRHSGAAILDGDRFVLAEAFSPRKEGRDAGFHEFRGWWQAFVQEHRPDLIGIEQPLRSDTTVTKVAYHPSDIFGKSVSKTKVNISSYDVLRALYGIAAIAIEVCIEEKIDYQEINMQEWRQIVFDRRTAPKGTKSPSAWWKSQSMDRCRMLGWNVPSADAAEAAMIAEALRISMTPAGRQRNPDLFERGAA